MVNKKKLTSLLIYGIKLKQSNQLKLNYMNTTEVTKEDKAYNLLKMVAVGVLVTFILSVLIKSDTGQIINKLDGFKF